MKLKINLGIPNLAKRYSDIPCDGVGLFRSEHLFLSQRVHPYKLILENRGKEFLESLIQGIREIASTFYPKPVTYRASDLKSNEHKKLKGGKQYEEDEENPALGLRGCSRYTSEKFELIFRYEIEAIKKVREEYDNLWLMIPFVRKPEELEEVKEILDRRYPERKGNFKLYSMIEVPSAAYQVKELSKYCDGFSIGSNDLTSLLFGVGRENEDLVERGYLEENNPIVKEVIKKVINEAHDQGCPVSICGDAPAKSDDFLKFLVKNKIDCISVPPDHFDKTRKLIKKYKS